MTDGEILIDVKGVAKHFGEGETRVDALRDVDLQVRAGYSQTITRPQFRELAPAFFVDEDTDLLLIGNPFLKNSELDNYDLRAEDLADAAKIPDDQLCVAEAFVRLAQAQQFSFWGGK